MSAVSIRELKQQVGPVPVTEKVHVQLEAARQKTTKTGNPFYELRFVDAEETLILRVWNDSPMFATCGQLQDRQFYEVSGDFGLGNDGKSVDAKRWEVRALDENEVGALLSGSRELRARQEEDYRYIETTIGSVSDPRLRAVGLQFLADHGERLKRTAAARDYHHARRGGLVEHVAQMMRSAVQICGAYTYLNRDLLVCGVLFHDVGKLWENAFTEKGFTMPYTEVSELIGHIPMGMEIVNRIWHNLRETPEYAGWEGLEPHSERVRLHLLHLIASHHGALEFGSPVVPKTPEAQALHYIDNLDAKMEMFHDGYQVAQELGRNVYERVRPLPGRLVAPLPSYEGGGTEPVSAVVQEEEEEPEQEVSFETEAPIEPGQPASGHVEVNPGDALPIPLPDDNEDHRPDPF